MTSYEEPVYLISIVSKMLDIHPQTLRQYERDGLVRPSRTNGKMRLYSQQDIDKIKSILILTRELGVNLAGVDIILKLREKVQELQGDVSVLRDELCKIDLNSVVPSHKSLVRKKSIYEVVIFKD
jgi:MerR family transcriptional regulator/heat shock protein HspR